MMPLHQLLPRPSAALSTALVLLVAGAAARDLSGATEVLDEKGQAAPAVAGRVVGRVVRAADGRPVARADVRLRRSDWGRPARRTTTGADGAFAFDAVAPGKYRVWAFSGNSSSRARMYRGDVVAVAPDGTSKAVVLNLRPGIAVRVKVLSQVDGRPIPGARVRLIWTDTDRDRFTNAKGEVELRALTPETWHVQATAKDHAAEVRALNLAAEQPAALEFRLSPGGAVRGRVRDEDGRPLPGVGINTYDGNRGEPGDYVETNAEGRYRLDHLPLGKNLRLLLMKLDYVQETKNVRIDADKGREARLDFVLKKRPYGGAVRGVVADRHGKPITGAEVANHGRSTNEVRRAKTDSQGKFLIDNVYESFGHELIARAKGFAPQRIPFKPGPATKPAEVAVTLEPGHRIRGKVVDRKDRPVPGARVYFAQGNRGDGIDFGGSATTDAQGRFAFDSLPANTPFTFVAEGYSEIPELALPLDGDNEVVVRLNAQGRIKGRVVDAATLKPLPRFTVRITFSPDRQPDDPVTSLTSRRVHPGEEFASPQGRFVLNDLLAGMPLQVTVVAAGYRRHVLRRVVAQADEDAAALDVHLTAEDPRTLVTVRGRLVNHRGEAVRGAELRLIVATDRPAQRDAYPFNWQMIETGQVDQAANVLQVQRRATAADGAFVFERVPGNAEIELFYWGKGVPGGRVDHLERLPEQERTRLVVRVPAPARLVGKIDRKAFPEISSIQLSGAGRYYTATLAPDGKSFVIDDLPAGNYEVQVYGPGTRVKGQPGAFQTRVAGRQAVTVQEGEEAKIALGDTDRSP